MDLVQDVRRFNRLYTRHIGLLEGHLPGSELSLPEGRVIYELAVGGVQTAADLGRGLELDKAHLSRVVTGLTDRGLIERSVDPGHGRRLILSLTAAGRQAFEIMDEGTRRQIGSILQGLDEERRRRFAKGLRTAEAALTGAVGARLLRGLRPGDLGWVIHRQAALYAEEYGWDRTYEGLIASILGGFASNYDPAREDGWVVERDGEILGSIFLMRSDEPETAKLRLLYVEPTARGLGLGRTLVETCIGRARELGYRRLTLWTNDVLVAARRIYIDAGFVLIDQAPHRTFGRDLVGQTWTLDL